MTTTPNEPTPDEPTEPEPQPTASEATSDAPETTEIPPHGVAIGVEVPESEDAS